MFSECAAPQVPLSLTGPDLQTSHTGGGVMKRKYFTPACLPMSAMVRTLLPKAAGEMYRVLEGQTGGGMRETHIRHSPSILGLFPFRRPELGVYCVVCIV
jgi:hypothetical protein